MDRATRFDEQFAFVATGRRDAEGLEAVDGLIPAAFAPLRDLARLRHDFPLVLTRDARGPGPVHSLSGLVDGVLRELAPKGMGGERLRKQALRLEREIRARSFAGQQGPLSELWEHAAAAAGTHSGDNSEEVLRYTASALKLDGDTVACDAAMPARFVTHAWEEAHAAKAQAFRKVCDALCVRLGDILRAAFIHSAAGMSPQALRASVGSARGDEFDFEAMSRLVSRRAPRDELPAARRNRIESALATLRTQRFYPDPKAPESEAVSAYEFRFTDCATAAAAFRERLPAMVQTVKAIAVAELEADGRYDPARHDGFFEEFAEHSLNPEDLAPFPDYLVCIEPGRNADAANANLMEMLSSGLPVKVLVETGDALEEAALGAGRFAFGVRSPRLAMTATSLGGVFVLQAPGSNLFALRARIAAGLAHRGPALFSVFAGSDEPAAGLAPYLTAAAAMQSRAFPSFSYDPHAGGNMAARFSFENNPQPAADWPTAQLEYCDEQQQRVVETPAFTFADFALCDRRYAPHFASVPRERWSAAMVPVADWLALPEAAAASCVPYVLAVDATDVLHRVLVDSRLVQATRRCLVLWHRLQELGGIHNSHAERLLAREKAAWEAQKAAEIEALKATISPPRGKGEDIEPSPFGAEVATPVPALPQAAASEAPARPAGEPWIETSRCPSCNECQLINDKLFLYNGNKQAYLGDLKAGTYRQMVEAAESCQVSIIHPGNPWNPAESGLEELVERAPALPMTPSTREANVSAITAQPVLNPITSWHAEHVYFRRLLDLLSAQVDMFETGERPNYELMLDIITYLREYSDRLHHPREDVAFERLARHRPELTPMLARLHQEHRVIARAGETLERLLTAILADSLIARAEVESVAATYLVYYGNHIATEESDVLAHAARALTTADWAAVRAAVPEMSDPLEGPAIDGRYRELRRRIALES